jgi:RNA polymerase sigma factor (sigma-70 family)
MNGELDDKHRSELGACAKALWRPVYDHAMVVTRGDHALAEDVTQMAFFDAWADWPKLRLLGESEREGWLKLVATNKAIDEFRRNERARNHQPEMWERYRPRDPDTHRDVMAAVALDRFWEVVATLPPQKLHVAVLRWKHNMSEKEIVKVMNIKAKTVSSHLSQTRALIRAKIGDHWPIDCDDQGGGTSS